VKPTSTREAVPYYSCRLECVYLVGFEAWQIVCVGVGWLCVLRYRFLLVDLSNQEQHQLVAPLTRHEMYIGVSE
jgi:hypothetical protein